MEFPELGKQCQVSMCQQLDFLPIRCNSCSKSFCKEHALPPAHQCPAWGDDQGSKEARPEVPGDATYRHPCRHPGCKGGELAPVVCPGCGENFCLSHRHQADHRCPSLNPHLNPMAEAAAKMEDITSRLDTKPPKRTPGRRSDKLAAKVQLMKLKQKAVGDGGLPQEERVYLLVLLPKGSSSQPPQRPIFFSHHWTIGKVIDTAAAAAKVKNNNNVPGAERLLLFHASDGSLLASPDQPLKALLADQRLFNGQTVILEYVAPGTSHLHTHKDYRAT